MLQFILKRLWVMLLTIICLTFLVFALTNLRPNLVRLAITQTNVQGTPEEYARWLDNRGYDRPTIVKYGEWLGVVPGWTNEINGVLENL